MAVMFNMPAILRERRSTQSGNYIMTAAWQVIYTSSSSYVYKFCQGTIDLTNMIAGDSINIRLSKMLLPLGNFIVFDQVNYAGVQPVGAKAVIIDQVYDVYGFRIEAQQNLGVFETLYCEFLEAFR